MIKVYGYIRVSTVKQGNGVSLQEQKEAIIRYAVKNDLQIIDWFEELETAAKQGRPLFTRMLKQIRENKAEGVIIHKIDRSARNLKDWASLGELIDNGHKIFFAHEGLDLNARGGRLTADIQAVIASDYIRNLKEEAIKGIYGRLKQGIYPFGAPVGYLNTGGGNVKAIDPIKAPLVELAFSLYASEKYSLLSLSDEMNMQGLKNSRGNLLRKNDMARILKNPFYAGVIKIKGQTYIGEHLPIINSNHFQKVQSIIEGKTNTKIVRHQYLFSKLIKCITCNFSLIGEMQKGIMYYRCHTKNCKTKGIREDVIERFLVNNLADLNLKDEEYHLLKDMIDKIEKMNTIKNQDILEALKLQENQLNLKLKRLTDAYLDNVIEKNVLEEKKSKLLLEKKGMDYKKIDIEKGISLIYQNVRIFLELLKSVKNSYLIGNIEEKRKIIKTITSNLLADGKNLRITMQILFQDIALRHIVSSCGLERDTPRNNTVEIANMATNIETVDNVELKERMKELLDRIINLFKTEINASNDFILSDFTNSNIKSNDLSLL